MKILIFLLSLFLLTPAYAAPQMGITPCIPSAQPGDLNYSGTSANVKLSSCGETLIVWNTTTNNVRYRLGTGSGTTATLTDNLLPASSYVILNVGINNPYLAVISSGTGSVSLTQGTAAP